MPLLLPGKSHGWRSLVDCNPWSREESDTTEQLHFSLSCIGEGNGNPLQCSCLENPRDGGAWWAAIYGVAQSRTRLKRLSSSSRAFKKDKITWTDTLILQIRVKRPREMTGCEEPENHTLTCHPAGWIPVMFFHWEVLGLSSQVSRLLPKLTWVGLFFL